MRIHTSLTEQDLRDVLKTLQGSGDIAEDVEFIWLSPMPSRSHLHGYEVRLGTYQDGTNPYRPNGKRFHADAANLSRDRVVYAAAWDEWGWFLTNLFILDPDMKTSHYKNCDDFHKKTENRFR